MSNKINTVFWLPLEFVLSHWRPGSFDRCWAEEFADRGSPDRIEEGKLRLWVDGEPQDQLLLRLLQNKPIEPITLGWDSGEWGGKYWYGRVWAGHYRLWVYHTIGRAEILCDVVPRGATRPHPANHCAPAEGRE